MAGQRKIANPAAAIPGVARRLAGWAQRRTGPLLRLQVRCPVWFILGHISSLR